MKSLQTLLVLGLLSSFQLTNAQFTDDINSNRPGRSMMAFSVGKSVFQTETGINYVNEDHNTLDYKASGFMAEFDLRWGLFFEQLELIGEFQYQNDSYTSDIIDKNRSALKKTLFGAKYLVYDPFKNYEEKPNLYSWKANHRFKWRQMIPAVAVYGGVNLNFSDNPFNFAPVDIEEPKISPKAMLIAQNHFGSRWVLVTNIAYNKIGTDFASIDYILTLTRGFNKQWSGFIENQGFMGDYYSDGVFRMGAAYLFNKDMQIDASIGKNLKGTPNLFTGGIGFSWRFTKNYKEVKIEKDNGSKMDKKMKKKGEKEAKKRKDAVEE
ncbi:MAG TPA: transporter [Flavobacterium sp.]|uniref:transporter n=1 Tax=Flavobacterium sp. TaxID=239 RepID=UPI002B4B3EED|nr:transporter [Flavobacterium sp.]HLO72957.1 transporter [Flavobacterium sp.]